MIDALNQMQPGECRWIGRHDLHVYCFGTRVAGVYRRDVRAFKVWTADSVGSPWDRGGWMTAEEASQLIKREIRNDK